MDWKHSPHLLPEKTFMLILWLGSCSNAHAIIQGGWCVGRASPAARGNSPCANCYGVGRVGWQKCTALTSPRGAFQTGKEEAPLDFFFFCLPGGDWHSFPSLYLSFSICNKLIQLLLLLKWRLSSPGRLFKRSWRHPESHTTFSPHICAFSSAELGVSGKTHTITSFYVWNDPRSWVLCQLAEAQRSDSSSSTQHTAPHPLSPSPLIRACDLAAEFGHNL